jgi:PTH2 family peptidyl-tRNA hydrolase
MELFEVHVTGDESIHSAASTLDVKTITIESLDRNGRVVKVDHMTSHKVTAMDYFACKTAVDSLCSKLTAAGVDVQRVKIESPAYRHYYPTALYVETHFAINDDVAPFEHPCSKSPNKSDHLGTIREWDKLKFEAFCINHYPNVIELCLYDTHPGADDLWFSSYSQASLDCKQVIVMRTDLNMRKGKMVAQGAHAAMVFLVQRLLLGRSSVLSEAEGKWLYGSFKKVCVGVGSEAELLAVEQRAKEAGLTVHLITDSGLTEFNGVPTRTCLAVGPDFSKRIDAVTGGLKLL